MDYSTPGFPVHHYHPEFAEIHVHWVGDDVSKLDELTSALYFSVF